MSAEASPLLILGIGNVLLGDEGFGVHVVEQLRLNPGSLPAGARLVDGGTLGIELLPLIEDAAALVMVDAVELGEAAGTLRCIEGDAIAGCFGGNLSAHQAGAADLIAVARLTGALPPRIALVGVQPESFGFSLELSPAVRAALPSAIEAVTRLARALTADACHA